jgi:hypothetical protein
VLQCLGDPICEDQLDHFASALGIRTTLGRCLIKV